MPYIKFMTKNNRYYHLDSDTVEMCILGNFLSSDVRCNGRTFFRDWAQEENELEECVSGNITRLERENNKVLLSDLYPVEEFSSIKLEMTSKQLVKLIDDWNEKVCKLKPKEVIIKYENNEFIFETKD